MKKILGIGNALVDIMTPIDDDKILEQFSLPKGSMQLVDREKSRQVREGTSHFDRRLASGGSAANTIHGLAMLGAQTCFIGSIGQDETGDFFENDLKGAGVNTLLLRKETVTGTAIALISPDSERTFATHLGAALELQATDLDPEYFRTYDILYLEGYLIYDRQLVEEACRIAKSMGMKIAIDLSSYNVVDARLADFREIIGNYADIVFANEEEARSYTGAIPEEALNMIAGECDIAVVKIGKDGSIIRRGEESVRIKSHPVNCMDTTGAGDLYAAGFLYGYAVDMSLERCGITGSLLAGNVIETIGARMDEIRWRDIKEYLKNQH